MAKRFEVDQFITSAYLLFVGFFSFLSLVVFYREIIMSIKTVTPQYVLAAFSIVGSSLLLLVTLVALATKQVKEKPYSKEKVVNSKSLVQERNKETIKYIEKLKEVKKSVEDTRTPYKSIVTMKNGAQVLKPYLDVPSTGVFQRTSNGLTQLQGMRSEHVTLLMEIGIKSINELSNWNPEELFRKILEQIRPHDNNRDWIPTQGMIRHWIRIARLRSRRY